MWGVSALELDDDLWDNDDEPSENAHTTTGLQQPDDLWSNNIASNNAPSATGSGHLQQSPDQQCDGLDSGRGQQLSAPTSYDAQQHSGLAGKRGRGIHSGLELDDDLWDNDEDDDAMAGLPAYNPQSNAPVVPEPLGAQYHSQPAQVGGSCPMTAASAKSALPPRSQQGNHTGQRSNRRCADCRQQPPH